MNQTLEHQPSTAHSWALAVEDTMTAERIGEWLTCIDDVRKQSAHFGPIGNIELVELLFGQSTPPHSREAAARTLRHRFAQEFSEEIAARETEILEPR